MKVELEINATVLFKMYEYAAFAKHHFQSEIAGWAHYSKEHGIYKLAPLLEQTVSGAEVNTFPDSILHNTEYDMSDMVVQWHSHVDMGCNPSAPDRELINEALELFPMLISIIVNCKHEYSALLSFRSVGRGNAQIQLSSKESYDVILFPYYSNNDVSKEVLAKCKKPQPVIVIPEKRSVGFVPQKHYYVNTEGTYGYWCKDRKVFVPLVRNFDKLKSADKEVIKQGAGEKPDDPAVNSVIEDSEDLFADWAIPLTGDDENERETLKAFVNDLLIPEEAKPFTQLMVKSKMLEDADKKRFHCYYDSNRISFMVTDNVTNNHIYIDPWLTEINGIASLFPAIAPAGGWNEYLAIVGYAKEPYLIEKIIAGT